MPLLWQDLPGYLGILLEYKKISCLPSEVSHLFMYVLVQIYNAVLGRIAPF